MLHSNPNPFDLPKPHTEDRQYSDRLLTVIKAEIQKKQRIPFSRFMEMALYYPGLGYYVSGLKKFGKAGDFITAPEISPLFSRTLARQLEQIFDNSSIRSVLELGAGSGKLAVTLLKTLEKRQKLPDHYYILDVSSEMQQRQKQAIKESIPHLLDRVVWLQHWPEKQKVVVIANEMLDAMPVERFLYHNGSLMMQMVTEKEGQLVFDYSPASRQIKNLLLDKLVNLPQPYLSEINLNYFPWFQSLFEALEQAVLFFIDYGYPEREYYLPERNQGTLQCFYQHRHHDDVFYYPGLQDITVSVNFTAVAQAATDAGFDYEGFVSQGDFLFNNGIIEIMQQENANVPQQQALQLAQQLKQLTLPGEMGEKFKVIGFSKNYQPEIQGFDQNDQSHTL